MGNQPIPSPFLSLDIGCGYDFHKHLARGSVNIDVKKPNWRITNFVQADATQLPIKSSCMNEVVCHQVIEHVENPATLLREMKRVSKQHGTITIGTPNPLHWRRLWHAIRNKPLELGFKEHIGCWTQHEICNLIEQTGLKAIRVWYEMPYQLVTENAFRYRLDRWLEKILPKALGKRHLMVTATNGSSNES